MTTPTPLPSATSATGETSDTAGLNSNPKSLTYEQAVDPFSTSAPAATAPGSPAPAQASSTQQSPAVYKDNEPTPFDLATQPKAQAPPQKQGVGGLLEDVAKGIGEGALQTGGTIAKAADSGLKAVSNGRVGIYSNDDLKNLDTLSTPSNTGQKVGVGIEGLAEFFAGEGAVGSASKALGLASKVTKLAEESPTVAKLVQAGLSVLKSSGVSAGQSAAHGQSAVTGALAGAAGGALAEGLGATARTIGSVSRGAQADALVAKGESLAGKVTGIAQGAAEKSGVTDASKISSLDSLHDAAQAIRDQHSPTFDALRQSSQLPSGGNMFDVLNERIKDNKRVVWKSESVQAVADAKQQIARDQSSLDDLFQSSGIPSSQLQAAKSAWRASSTLDRLHGAIDRAYTESGTVRAGSSSIPNANPIKFVTQANRIIEKEGRASLTQALGKENADNLIQLTRDTREWVSDRQKQKLATGAVRALAGGAGAYAGYKVDGLPGALGGAAAGVIGGPQTINSFADSMHWLYSHPAAIGSLKAILKGGVQLGKEVTFTGASGSY